MLNRVVMVGRLTRDPELKYTPQGVAVAQMGIAVDRFTKNEQGDYETDFFNVVAWRRTAEFANQYLTKGRLISVDGRLQSRSWVAQDGTKRSTVEIVADSLNPLDKPNRTENAYAGGDAGSRVYGGGEAPAQSDAGGRSHGEPRDSESRPTAAVAAASGRETAAADEPDEADPFADE